MLNKLGRLTKINQDREGREVPAGQFVTEKFPVLTFGPTPKIDLATWEFLITGLVEEDVTLNWEEFDSLPKVALDAEFHCVTQWSKLQNTWEGVLFTDVMKLAKVSPDATHVMVDCYGGYSTNIALDVLMDDDVLFAFKHDGETITSDHGGPLRLVVPKRYAWKSAKWVKGIEFMPEDMPGFWEVRGYHMNGDPWKEERFWDDLG